MNLMLKFIAVFAVVGLVVSVTFGFIGGNRVTNVIFTAVICTLLSAALGGGLFKVLEIRVPEFLNLFRGGEHDLDDIEQGLESDYEDAGDYGPASPDPAMAVAEGEGDGKNFGDHILVNKVKIKNEPKLMAQAIRTMLARDDDS